MTIAESMTKKNAKLTLNLVLNYGGKWDILQAAKTLTQQVVEGLLTVDQIDESKFACVLNTHGLPDPDLFIRTSGEQRVSNFFLWQLAYTELYFTDVHWPDFTVLAFEEALTCFSLRKRRYGLTGQQRRETTDV
jgi:undecaprenyl diphosphate synthase